MDHKKHNHIDPWDDGVYGTGNTMPPKSSGGIIALLLMLVIFLSGIISALSFLNVRLFQQLRQQNQEQVPLSLAIVQDPVQTVPRETTRESIEGIGGFTSSQEISGAKLPTAGKPTLGLLGDTITKFDQAYFHVPQGLYLTQVFPGTSAAQAGIEPGDILISLNGEPVLSQMALDTIVSGFSVGDTVQAVFYRDGGEISLELTITESSE